MLAEDGGGPGGARGEGAGSGTGTLAWAVCGCSGLTIGDVGSAGPSATPPVGGGGSASALSHRLFYDTSPAALLVRQDAGREAAPP